LAQTTPDAQTSPTYPKPHILNMNNQTKNFDDDDKHNLQAKKPVKSGTTKTLT
jgi:hypothetical protein